MAVVQNIEPFYFTIKTSPSLKHFVEDIHPAIYGTSIIIRFVLCLTCAVEAFRTISYFIVISFTSIEMFQFCLRVIQSNQLGLGLLGNMEIYTQLELIFSQLGLPMKYLLGEYIVFLHFFIIVLAWVCFKAYRYLPVFIYVSLTIIEIVTVLQVILVLDEMVSVRELSFTLIRNWKQGYCTAKGASEPLRAPSHYIMRKAKATKPIYFTCMDFFIPRRSTQVFFLKYTVDNLVSALLVINVQ